MATQWHKRILRNFSLELEDQFPVIKDASQGRWLGSGLVISHLKDSYDREEKKKKKTNRPPSISMDGLH